MSRAVTVLLVVAVLACVAWAEEPVNKSESAQVQGNNAFAFDLYAQLRQGNGNIFLSPFSISDALAMTYMGARGETAEQMAKTLHLVGAAEVAPAFRQLIGHLNDPKRRERYELLTANALWGQQGYQFVPAYLDQVRKDFGGTFQEVDFAKSTEASRQRINRWVEEQTKDKIKDLLQPGDVTAMTRLVLTNAIYFKSSWLHPFSPGLTKKDDFLLPGGKKTPVQMMHQTEGLRLLETDAFQALELPYQGRELSMVIFLPRKADGLAEFEKSLSREKLDEWLGKLKPAQVAVALPKFRMTTEFRLVEALTRLGMPAAFQPGRADFSGIDGSRDLFVGNIIHKAFVDVDEKGTEAAAATAVAVRATSALVQQPRPFRADHPFFFVLRDNQSGSLLFMGRLVQP